MAMASSLNLTQHKSKAADLRDKMQQQSLAQTGVDAPKIAGRKGSGSGISAASSGAWGRVAVNRQFAAGAVEHETNVLRGPKPASEPPK